jgi:hypothetical protein
VPPISEVGDREAAHGAVDARVERRARIEPYRIWAPAPARSPRTPTALHGKGPPRLFQGRRRAMWRQGSTNSRESTAAAAAAAAQLVRVGAQVEVLHHSG